MSCPVCGEARPGQGPRRYLRCPACGLLFAKEMRAGDAQWYEHTWLYSSSRAGARLSLQAIEANWAWRTFLTEVRPAGGTLLDVGCGQGEFLFAARARGFDVEGIDFQPEQARAGRDLYGVAIACGDVLDLLVDGRRADIVTAFEIVEHVERPVEFLRTLGRTGRLVAVSVPCAERRPALFARGIDDPPHHLTIWTRQALRQALEAAGLEVHTICGDRYRPLHLGTYLSSLLGGRYPLSRYARGAARRLGTALGRAVRAPGEGPFTLFALARSTTLAEHSAARCPS